MSNLIPLTVLEKFLFWEDRPAYPWLAFCKYEFDGVLDRIAFQQAADDALERHVLLRSKIVEKGRRLYWNPVESTAAPIQWNENPRSAAFPKLKYIDLRQETGLQIMAIPGQAKTELIFGGHHACADALGGASYARDVFINYANLTDGSGTKIQLPKLDNRELLRRGNFGMGWRQFFKQLPMQLIGLAGARQFLGRNPVPLEYHSAASDLGWPAGYPHVVTLEMDRELTSKVRQMARAANGTLNDLLARDLFIIIDQWRNSKQEDRDQWIRMMIPMNVRTRETRDLPAANFVSSIFLDRRGDDFDRPAELLTGISREMNLIKENNLGMTFLFSLKLLDWIPGRLRRAATADRCTASFIFSNLDRHYLRLPFPKDRGKLVIGNLTLQRAWTIAPLRPYSLASFMSLVYDGQLLLTLHYDARFIEKESADDLLEKWARQIQSSAERVGQ